MRVGPTAERVGDRFALIGAGAAGGGAAAGMAGPFAAPSSAGRNCPAVNSSSKADTASVRASTGAGVGGVGSLMGAAASAGISSTRVAGGGSADAVTSSGFSTGCGRDWRATLVDFLGAAASANSGRCLGTAGRAGRAEATRLIAASAAGAGCGDRALGGDGVLAEDGVLAREEVSARDGVPGRDGTWGEDGTGGGVTSAPGTASMSATADGGAPRSARSQPSKKDAASSTTTLNLCRRNWPPS